MLGAGQVDIVATGYYTPDVKRGICKKIRLNPCCSVIIRNENRKRAYQYIKEQSEKLNPISDKAITDVNYVSLDELIRLKNGLADPSLELVQALRKLFIGVASKEEMYEYLFRPFHHKT